MRKILFLLLLLPLFTGCDKEDIEEVQEVQKIEYLRITQKIKVEFIDNSFNRQLVEFELREYDNTGDCSVSYYRSIVNDDRIAELDIFSTYEFIHDEQVNRNVLVITKVGNFSSTSLLNVELSTDFDFYLNLECYPKDLFRQNGKSVPDYATNSCAKFLN